MKKLITLCAVVLMSAAVFGQVLQPTTQHDDASGKISNAKFEKLLPLKNAGKASNERWYNYGETMDIFYGNTSVLYGNNLFPDTTILVDYGTSGYSGPWIHMLGDVLDVREGLFNDVTIHPGELVMGPQSTFNVDSIGILCFYERNMADPNIVDTLLIEVAVNSNLSSPYFVNGGINTNLGSDTVFIQQIAYAQATNTLNISTKKIYKFPLTEQFYQDSLDNGFHYVEISTSDLPVVNAGKFVVTALSYIPGYTWTPNVDTLIQKNRFFFVSFKEQDEMFPIYQKKNFNISYIIPQDVRYNVAASWNGLFVPSYAYMGSSAGYNYEHHLIYYKVTCASNCSEASIENPSSANNMLGDAYPNPSSCSAMVTIPVKTISDGAVLSIKNILGQTVATYNNIPAGQNDIMINVSNLPAGIYLYSLETQSGTITKKLTIN